MLPSSQHDDVMLEISKITNSAELFFSLADGVHPADYQYGTPELDLAAQHAVQSTLLRIAIKLS